MAVSLNFSVKVEGFEELGRKFATATAQAKNAMAEEIRRTTEPYVPMLTGSLVQRSRVIDNVIIYPGPYAHYLYEGVVYVDPQTGKAGFLTKKGWRSRYGVKKVPSDRTLQINTSKHEMAQSHWMEASAAVNMETWEKKAGEAILNKFK